VISVVIPTIAGREVWLERCLAAYRNNTHPEPELIVIHDAPNCRTALTSLLLPARAVDPNEYLALLGALGVLLGVALATTAEPTG